MRIGLSILTILMVTSCSKEQNTFPPNNLFSAGKKLAELSNKKLDEVSGLAMSINNPGYLWTHNDSGNSGQVFLIDQKLAVKLTVVLEDLKNRDWEDIAVGPGPDPKKNYIYIAEIGDNDAKYQYKYIYRFEEPVLNDSTKKLQIASVDKIAFQLPDGKKDTESLLLDPDTKDLYIVSKREEPVYVYQLKYPYHTNDTLTASVVATLPLTQIVAADFSANGKELLMKNYEHIYYWNNDEGKAMADLLKEMPTEVPYQIEPQGEAIAWARDGSGFFTLSEKNVGKASFLYFYQRK